MRLDSKYFFMPLRIIYMIFFIVSYLSAKDDANTILMVFSLYAAAISFIPPAIWNKKVIVKYWPSLVINIFLYVIVVVLTK